MMKPLNTALASFRRRRPLFPRLPSSAVGRLARLPSPGRTPSRGRAGEVLRARTVRGVPGGRVTTAGRAVLPGRHCIVSQCARIVRSSSSGVPPVSTSPALLTAHQGPPSAEKAW